MIQIEQKTFLKVGVFSFAVITICTFANLLIFWSGSNWWSRTSTMASIFFNLVLTLFFFSLLKMQSVSVSQGEMSKEEIEKAFDEMETTSMLKDLEKK